MSSRPPLGVQQRQAPSRSLSGSGTLSQQRPAHQRTLSSSQYYPSSPVRANPGDLAIDSDAAAAANSASHSSNSLASASQSANGGVVVQSQSQSQTQTQTQAQTQYGTPRRGGSRLRLELANDGITHTGFVESPTSSSALDPSKSFTPSRVIPASLTEPSELGDMNSNSPHTSRGGWTADNDNTPMPMPKRRCRFSLADNSKRNAPLPAPPPAKPSKDNRPKPYTIEVPVGAPKYTVLGGGAGKETSSQSRSAAANAHLTGYADFTPWTGDGPEDHFTQTFIQNGYFDKLPAGQAEIGSARAAIFPSLKHKTGLYALSTVFTGLLASRRHNGQITAPSTFKPPPRVTLTDTKREGWLKDLANPTISLRRLSRTIPHGIRGKGLLEQCLNKNVPTDRAVWLAKCVGANEIRAFKRKGVNGAVVMGGEAKWIRDWTVFVEQFVDGVVSSFGDDEWKIKVNYAIRLATHLYAEHLLDRDHYMEWLVSSLENCPQARLPMCLLIIQIYWKDLLRLRRFGRRLVTSLLDHYTTVQNHADHDIFLPLSSKLFALIQTLIHSTAVNFVSPSTWPKHREVLILALSAEDDASQAAFHIIDTRNEQLLSSGRAAPAARHSLVKILDGALHAPLPEDLPTKCWHTFKDPQVLVRTTLEWCTSLHRPGPTKVYVALHLLSTWANYGVNITGLVLEFMVSDSLDELDRKTSFYHLVAELVRCGLFEPLRYIQWLIARGGLHDPDGVLVGGPAASRLLVELPVSTLHDSLRTMRANMLGRASYNVDYEATDTAVAISCVKSSLGLQWASDTPPSGCAIPVDKLCKRIKRSSRALKSEIGQCLKQLVVEIVEQAQGAAKEGLHFPTSTFITARSILEAAEDFQSLAEFLKMTAGLFDADILSYCADTLNLHLAIFGALGVAKELFDVLVGKLSLLKQEQGATAVRLLLNSMALLAPRFPGQEQLVADLNETIRNDRNSAVDASSPVSDNMAARIQDGEVELLDEIEKRLANKTSMDRTTMNSFLNKIIPKIQACWAKTDETLRAYSSLLARLRPFDTQHFDSFMTKWVLGIRNPQNRPPLGQIFPLMISVGCLNFSIILTTTSDAVSASSRPSTTAAARVARPSTYAQEVLGLFTVPAPSNELLTPEEAYQFQILQSQAPKTHFKELVVLIRNALAEYCSLSSQAVTDGVPLADERARKRLLDLLRVLVLTDQAAAKLLIAKTGADAAVSAMLDVLTTQLLFPNQAPGELATFNGVLAMTNDLTLPVCQLKLLQLMAAGETSATNPQERLQSQLDAYSKALDDAIASRNLAWIGILPLLPAEVTQHLLNRAQTRLFDLTPSVKNPVPVEGSVNVAETLLSMVEMITRGASSGPRPPAPLVPMVVERLADLWELLATPSESSVKMEVLQKWLPLMLSYLALHAQAQDSTNKQTSELRGRVLLVLSGLLQELEGLSPLSMCDASSSPMAVVPSLHQRIFDIALLFADSLPDDVRQQCIRHLRDALSDARLRYLFSFAPAPHDSLMLSQKEKAGSNSTSTPQAGRPRGTGFLGIGSVNQNPYGVPVPIGGLNASGERLSTFTFRRWEILNEPTPNIGENDTSLSLTFFEGIKLQ